MSECKYTSSEESDTSNFSGEKENKGANGENVHKIIKQFLYRVSVVVVVAECEKCIFRCLVFCLFNERNKEVANFGFAVCDCSVIHDSPIRVVGRIISCRVQQEKEEVWTSVRVIASGKNKW